MDRDDPLAAAGFTPAVDAPERLKEFLPTVYLACPHGVFPYGAIVWCCYCRWGCGIWQYTGAADVVKRVPGLRYMHSIIWIVSASKRSIVRALRERCAPSSQGGARRGGVLGIPPDGILGAFRSKPGVDARSRAKNSSCRGCVPVGTPSTCCVTQELVIGPRRGSCGFAQQARKCTPRSFWDQRPPHGRPGPVGPQRRRLLRDESGRHGLLRALVPAYSPPRRALGLRRTVRTTKTASSSIAVWRLRKYGRLRPTTRRPRLRGRGPRACCKRDVALLTSRSPGGVRIR